MWENIDVKKQNLLGSRSSLTSSKTSVFPTKSLIPSRPPLTRFPRSPPLLCFTVTRAFTVWEAVMVLLFLELLAITTFLHLWTFLCVGKESLRCFKNHQFLFLLFWVSSPCIYKGKDELLRILIRCTCEFLKVNMVNLIFQPKFWV